MKTLEELLLEIEELRKLDEETAEKRGIPGLIDQVNRLRNPKVVVQLNEVVEGSDAIEPEVVQNPEKRGPGRPRKS